MATKFGSIVLWEKAEDNILVNKYHKGGLDGCLDGLEKLGLHKRSASAVYARVRKLGLVGGKLKPGQKRL
jgi:hypothetical protein